MRKGSWGSLNQTKLQKIRIKFFITLYIHYSMKRELTKNILAFVLIILGINLVQAYYSGGFGSGIGRINPQDLYLSISFVVSFFIFNLAFSRFFRGEESEKSGWIPALFLAIGTTYGLWRIRFDFGILFSRINLSYEIWSIIVGILVLIFVVFLLRKAKKKFKIKFKTNAFFAILGIIFLFLGLQNIVYSAGASILIGIILIIVGFFSSINKILKYLKPKKKEKHEVIKEIKK